MLGVWDVTATIDVVGGCNTLLVGWRVVDAPIVVGMFVVVAMGFDDG